jgi:hypothetical protein
MSTTLNQLLRSVINLGISSAAVQARNHRQADPLMLKLIQTVEDYVRSTIDRHLGSDPGQGFSPAEVQQITDFVTAGADFISQHSGIQAALILKDKATRETAIDLAAKRLHPDLNPSSDGREFNRLMSIARVMRAYDEVRTA